MIRRESTKAYRSSQLASWFAPKQISPIAVAEVVGLISLLMLLCWWIDPHDPFLLNRPFPWLWLLPALLALRYGTLAAFLAVGLLAGLWFLLPLVGIGGGDFPESFFLGGFILTLICGEFADIWTARLRRVRSVNAYLNERLNSLTNHHYLLRLSYERLGEELLVKPVTLRDALQRLRRLIVGGGEEPLPHAQALLNLLSKSCQLSVASLYLLQDNVPQGPAVAVIGEASELDPKDPLVEYALEERQLSHVQTQAVEADNSRYLVVAPVIDSGSVLLGLLLVERIPFLALNEETLRFLTVLLGYYADAVKLGPATRSIIAQVPDCGPQFAGELMCLHRIHQDVGIQSVLAALVIAPGIQQEEIAQEALRLSRKLDMTWMFEREGKRYIFILMPLHGEMACAGFFQRTERWLQDVFGLSDFSAAGVLVHSTMIGTTPPAELLTDFLALCEGSQNVSQGAKKA